MIPVVSSPDVDSSPVRTEAVRETLTQEVGVANVGDYVGFLVDDEQAVTYLFESTQPGYQGWQWNVSVATVADPPTVNEVVLVPTATAIVAPTWVPYRDRIRPGDLSPGDLLPVEEDDPRLVPTYDFGEDDLYPDERQQIRAVARELGLGRVRTLSYEGTDLAAARWYESSSGPEAPLAQAAPHPCASCGFLVRLQGRLSELFGVCANADANDDGRVVAFDHGCGAHSEVQLAKRLRTAPPPPHVLDTLEDFEPL